MKERTGDKEPEPPFGDEKAPLAEVADFRDEMAGAWTCRRGDPDRTLNHPHALGIRLLDANWRSSAPLSLLRKDLNADEWAELGANVVQTLEREFGRRSIESMWPAHNRCRYSAGIASGSRGCGIGMSCT